MDEHNEAAAENSEPVEPAAPEVEESPEMPLEPAAPEVEESMPPDAAEGAEQGNGEESNESEESNV